ncbi:MAG: glycosyltransferase family 4 protein, partial [candidate division Zixibacteria bacterium]|nr:glycosyltransferase family 4 protein [candidate division Zixibacteria bacterium]
EHIPFSANLKIPSETNKTPENSAITYLPEGSEEFYGWEFVKPLILKYPMVKFYILGNPGIEGFNKENAIFLGWIENVDDYIKKCKVYLRRTIHDGTPILIQQSLAYGRTVLFNHDFPHCRKFDEVEFEDAIYNWSFNQEGRDFIAREYSPEIISRRLISLYEIQ